MAMKAAASNRAPRGTKPVVQAFFAAADEVPETSRPAVIKAALASIRDQLKADREKAAAAKAKAKGATPAKKAAPKRAAAKKAGSKTPAKAPARAKTQKAPAKRARKTAAGPTPETEEAQEKRTTEREVATPDEERAA